MWKLAILFAMLVLASTLGARAQAALPVVSAESVYGDIARQIGGDRVAVVSILNNPDQDPHLFEASPSVARALSAARLVIYNGIGYDSWMQSLLSSASGHQRAVIVVADLAGFKPGDNPHVWYDTGAVLALARALAAALASADPAHGAGYRQRLAVFEQAMQPVTARIAALRARLAGTPVTATEPVFGDMFAALGMPVRDRSFQLSVMNDTEPSASDVAGFEHDLRTHAVKLMVYNSQATDPIAERMQSLAQAAHVPVIGVTETEPSGMNYQAWMMTSLDAVSRALP